METNRHEGIGLDTIKRKTEWKEIERIEIEWILKTVRSGIKWNGEEKQWKESKKRPYQPSPVTVSLTTCSGDKEGVTEIL